MMILKFLWSGSGPPGDQFLSVFYFLKKKFMFYRDTGSRSEKRRREPVWKITEMTQH